MPEFCVTHGQKRILLRVLNDRAGVLKRRHEVQTRDDYITSSTASSEELQEVETLIKEVEDISVCDGS